MYEVKVGKNEVRMPIAAEIICATSYPPGTAIWVEQNVEDIELTTRTILVMVPGEELEEKMSLLYIGYSFLPAGEIVIVFEIL
jgi:hypothetical protein